jgi:integrase
LYRLREIDLFFGTRGVTRAEVPESVFELWARKRENESNVNHRRRVLVLIAFSKFMANRGYVGVHIGEAVAIHRNDRFVPYIFSKSEIAGIFGVLRKNVMANPTDSETAAFAVMFCLYYGCGLRKTEVQKLRLGDVDIDDGSIRVMDSKNHESRLVVASGSLRRQISKYCGRFRVGYCDRDAYLFPNADGSMFSDGKLYGCYHRTLKTVGIGPRENGHLPRIHDLRHTFCVHALESMVKKGFDLYVSLPSLVAYLGHRCISETEYYLRFVEENFAAVTNASREYAPTLFPKVGGPNGE